MAVSRTVKRTPEWREMLKRSLLRSGALIGAIALMLSGAEITAEARAQAERLLERV